MDKTELRAIVEAFLFMANEPLTTVQIKKLVSREINKAMSESEESDQSDNSDQSDKSDRSEESDNPLAQLMEADQNLQDEISVNEIRDVLVEIGNQYNENSYHGFELAQVAKGYQFRTKPSMAPYLKRLYKLPKPKLSAPSMETLSIVAYQQPIDRLKVEQIRGVDSGGVLRTLLDRDLVKIVGRSDEPGHPLLYGTSRNFLETFSLKSLSDLPTLKDLKELDPALNELIDEAKPKSLAELLSEEVDAEMEIMEESSKELITELDDTIQSLRDLEKEIFHPKQEVNEEEVDPEKKSSTLLASSVEFSSNVEVPDKNIQ